MIAPLFLLLLPQGAVDAGPPTDALVRHQPDGVGSARLASPALIPARGEHELALLVRRSVSGTRNWEIETSIFGRIFSSAGLDRGSLGLAGLGARIHATRPIGSEHSLEFDWSFEELEYDFSPAARIDGVEEAFLLGFDTSLNLAVAEDVRLSFHAGADLGADEGAQLEQAVAVRGGATVRFPVTRTIDLTLGGFGSSRLEERPLFYPWLQLDWRAGAPYVSGRPGRSLDAGFGWKDSARSYARFSFAERQYRFDRFEVDGALHQEGVIRDDDFSLTFGIILPWNKRLEIEIMGGVTMRELNVLDHGGQTLFADTTDPAAFAGVALNYGFF